MNPKCITNFGIRLQKFIKFLALNDFSQMNSNNTHFQGNTV
jgi:hypothetical protein